ncbi:DUF2972 domain-containing protein, partial [Helicobacter bilis]|uniref:DUF2972 domain-containing protein n=1 Tax=Helicobacter bilis TaxID=37372 RepID=UPI00248D6E5D
ISPPPPHCIAEYHPCLSDPNLQVTAPYNTHTQKSINTNGDNAMSVLPQHIQLYPPLLQPDTIDYSTIDYNLALELRLPPKVRYKFVFIRYGLSGGAAMSDFLTHSSVSEMEYKKIFKHYCKQQDICLYINHLWQREEKDLRRVLYALKNNDWFLILVRDPISRIKTAINHGWFKHGRNYDHIIEFDINDDFYKVVDSMGFFNTEGKLVSNHAFIHNDSLKHIIGLCSFAYYSNIAVLPKNANITYLDMQEIMPDKAFDTMTKLAKKFNFSLPKEENRKDYVDIRFGNFFYILPLTFAMETQNSKKVKVHISAQHNIKSVSVMINHILFDTPHPLLDQVAFSMSEDDLKALQDDKETLDKVKAYMVRFLDELKKRTDYIQRNKKHENDVLEIFRGDRDLRRKFKAMLDRELIHIKAHRPDIVASWKYYQEFERMCVEEGDM